MKYVLILIVLLLSACTTAPQLPSKPNNWVWHADMT